VERKTTFIIYTLFYYATLKDELCVYIAYTNWLHHHLYFLHVITKKTYFYHLSKPCLREKKIPVHTDLVKIKTLVSILK